MTPAAPPRPSFRPGLIFLVWLAIVATVPGQTPLQRAVIGSSTEPKAVAPTGSEATRRTLETRLAEARTTLAGFSEGGLTNAPVGIAAQELWMRRAMLTRLVRLYEQQLSDSSELETAQALKAARIREAETWTRFAEPPPYSILVADRLREELQAEQQQVRQGETSAVFLAQLINENRALIDATEEKIRQLNEQLETANRNPAESARLVWQREQERIRSQMASAMVASLDLERSISQETLGGNRARLGLLQRQMAIADADVKFTQADLEEATAKIERERAGFEAELGEAMIRQRAAAQALETAREEARLAQGSPAAAARTAELVSAREAQLEATAEATRVLRMMLESRNVERAMWEQRYAAYDTRNVATLGDSARRLAAFTRRLELWRAHERQQLDVSASQIQLQQTRLNSLAPGSDLAPLIRERLAGLRETDQVLLRFVRTLEQAHRLAQRWDESLRAAEARLPFLSRVQSLFTDAQSFLRKFWSFELFVAEDTITVDGQKITGKRSVTVGKIVMAVFILVAGIWITGILTRLVEPIIVKRLRIETNQAVLIRRWMRAAMVAGLLLFSMVSVKIPLTVFAFAGGALAIGLGFGMQTILKNLVSGLIILFERPFRVGDVLDVGGQRGTVTSVGLRASVLQLWDGTETLIPNSTLLETNLTNWTYSNRKVRFTVAVGVGYGSDPRRVIQLLTEVAERHGLVEKEPKPQVFFTEFGDSTLAFELRFWLDVSKANASQVSSDLRLMIASVFADHGISIDYPQRDLHLHSARPLQVQVVPVTPVQAGEGGVPARDKAADPPGGLP